MNSIRKIRELNDRELEHGISPEASWHADYRDTAYIYIGGLPFDLSEGDIIAIFSQYGEPVHVHLIRDKDTGKSKGFAFLKYEDQRSTDLAVDNLGGATVMGRLLRVDHTRYKKKDDPDEDTVGSRPESGMRELNEAREFGSERSRNRSRSKEERKKHHDRRSRHRSNSSSEEYEQTVTRQRSDFRDHRGPDDRRRHCERTR